MWGRGITRLSIYAMVALFVICAKRQVHVPLATGEDGHHVYGLSSNHFDLGGKEPIDAPVINES